MAASSTTATADAKPHASSSSICWLMSCEIIMSRGVPSRIGVTKKPRQMTKTSRQPLTTPGRLSGRNTCRNAAPRSRAEARRGPQVVRVDLLHHREEGKDHVGQQDVRHAERRGERGEEQLRRRAEPERLVRRDHGPLAAEDHQPRVGAHEEARPEAHGHDGEQAASTPSRSGAPSRRRPDSRARRQRAVTISEVTNVLSITRV